MPRKNPNGYGGVTKLSGNRRKPYMAYTSEIVTEGVIVQKEQITALNQLSDLIKGASSGEEAFRILEEALAVLYEASGSDFDTDTAVKFALDIFECEKSKRLFKAKQKKKPLGYFETYKEASIVLAQWNSNPEDFENNTITFSEVWEMAKPTLKLDSKSQSAQYSYKMGYDKCDDLYDVPIKNIKTVHLQKVIDKYSAQSTSAQRQVLQVFHAVYQFAVQNDIVDRDYSKYVTVTKKEATHKKAFTPEEVQLIRNNIYYQHKGQIASTYDGLPVAKIILVLIFTGLRINELLTLKVSDVNIDKKYISVNGTKTSSAVRIVPIHKEIEGIVAEQCEASGKYLFSRSDGKQLNYHSFKDSCYARFLEMLGISHTIHETRHTFATYSAISMNPKARAFVIGHAQGITDDRYTHPELIADQLKAEIDKISI